MGTNIPESRLRVKPPDKASQEAVNDVGRVERTLVNCVYFGHYGISWAQGASMKSMSAKDAKNGFGLLLDTARAEPVTIEKHGRAVVVVLSIEEYERLKTVPARADARTGKQERKRQI